MYSFGFAVGGAVRSSRQRGERVELRGGLNRRSRWTWGGRRRRRVWWRGCQLVEGGGEHAIRKALDTGDLDLVIAALELSPVTSDLPGSLAFEILKLAPNSDLLSETRANALYFQLGPERHNLLRGFSSFRKPSELPFRRRLVSDDDLMREAGVPLSSLRPPRGFFLKWQLLGLTTVIGMSYALRATGNQDLMRPLGLIFLVALILDQALVRGAVFEGLLRIVNRRYAERVERHEAGHFLVAYLLGMPVRGYVLNAIDAVRVAGIRGQAGTVFADSTIEKELRKGRLSEWSIDRFSIVVMAGIASEALEYGQAEGGRSDEEQLIQLLTSLNPPWALPSIVNQAKFGAIEALLLLKRNRAALDALAQAIREKKPLGDCIESIEKRFVADSTTDQASESEKQPIPPDVTAAAEEILEKFNEDLQARLDSNISVEVVDESVVGSISRDEKDAVGKPSSEKKIHEIQEKEKEVDKMLKEIEEKLESL